MNRTNHATRDAQAVALAEAVAGDLNAALSARGSARLAVPGGTTPGPFLTRLGQAALNWDRVVVTLTDERWVSASDPRSNQRLLGETLFRGAAAAARFVPLSGDGPGPEDGLRSLTLSLQGMALPLDVAVLGMGADGHTASLFPGATGLAEALAPDAPPAVAIRAAGAPEPRITLSAPALLSAPRAHLLIAGADKVAALERALEDGPVEDAPVRAILRGARSLEIHYAD